MCLVTCQEQNVLFRGLHATAVKPAQSLITLSNLKGCAGLKHQDIPTCGAESANTHMVVETWSTSIFLKLVFSDQT